MIRYLQNNFKHIKRLILNFYFGASIAINLHAVTQNFILRCNIKMLNVNNFTLHFDGPSYFVLSTFNAAEMLSTKIITVITVTK